eukprot:757796-Hanusia_phi.AAC.1
MGDGIGECCMDLFGYVLCLTTTWKVGTGQEKISVITRTRLNERTGRWHINISAVVCLTLPSS